ncbi:hypothetical protein OHB14_39020 [Streptomyces sp. NBC_01613]|uniref:hypothetical protein n=1 Tax=Streptomyces sp. NBC_01613 TaxID=2975896 RepID=UPI00386318EA
MNDGGNFHIGDAVTQIGGSGNTGIYKNQASAADPQAAFRDMIQAIQVMRGQVSAEDRQVIDDSLQTIGNGANADPGTMRRALTAIAGVATMVGQVGVPVIEAVRRVTALFGG